MNRFGELIARHAEAVDEMEHLNDEIQRLPETASHAEIERLSRGFELARHEAERLSANIRRTETVITARRRLATTSSNTGVGLSREERMADWAARRGHVSTFDSRTATDFSLGRVVRGMVTGNWEGAEVEQRALSFGTNAAGGFLTPEPLANFVIDRIRNQARVIQAGARTIPMESDQLSIPRLASGVTGAWRNENTPVAESDPTFERVTFNARTLAVLVRLSYELFQDLTPEGAQIIENELVQALALEIDRVALRGTGTAPEPRGVRNQTGVDINSLGANGATPTNWSGVITSVSTIQGKNVEPNAAIWASRTAKTYGSFTDTTNQPLALPPFLEGLSFFVSNQIPTNLTAGTSTDTSEIYVGKFDELLIGFRPVVGISVQGGGGPAGMVGLKASDERYLDQMQVGLLAFARCDVQVAHPEAFSVITGVRP